MWKLISYSDLKIPLKPYKSNYSIGIVENDSSQRKITQINKKYSNQLSIGMYGKIECINGINGDINVFIPELDDVKTDGNKVALITGSSRGIGRAIAIELAKNEFDIIINNNEYEKEGIETANEINQITNAAFIKCDIINPDQVNKMIEKTISEYGKIDVLVNNAGIAIDKKFENMTLDQWKQVISVNLTGAFNCTKAVIDHMQKQGGGTIINISSVIGEIGNIGQANYAASKGGLIAFTKSLAKEYAKDGIYVNAIAPGFIKTKMTEAIPSGNMRAILEQIPLGRLGTPEEVAKVVRFLVAESSYITGQVINVNGGLYM
ncbi:MAG: hypothetical protein C5S49_06490 [Candidatus Methanogaster sp.]|nr:MAG: hypothetical protein C5S49_06490 [ANME-2 cluster archaeon]